MLCPMHLMKPPIYEVKQELIFIALGTLVQWDIVKMWLVKNSLLISQRLAARFLQGGEGR